MTWYHPALAQGALRESDDEIKKLRAENKELRAALERAAEKLKVYRKHTDGSYQGGMEYTQLMYMIEGAMRTNR